MSVSSRTTKVTRTLAVDTTTTNGTGIFNGAGLGSVSRRCVTTGMKEILEAREIHFYPDWFWQGVVSRRAVHGPVTPHFPASYPR